MDYPFDSPRMLVDEAEEGITRLEERVEAFISHQDRVFGSELDRKTGEHLLYVQYPTDIPPKISMEIRAVARDLRDALDHAVYASSVTLFGGDPHRTKFLVADTADGLCDELKRGRCKDVHEDIIAFMLKENACETGNRTIWALNQFRNRSTHRVVSLANASANGVGINAADGGMTISTMNEWRSTRRLLYYARIRPHGPKLKLKISPTIEIRAHSVFGLGAGPATAGLRMAANEVKRINTEIERETTRIKEGGS